MRRLHICNSIQIIRKIALPLPFVFVFVSLSIFSGGLGAANVYAQVFPPIQQFPQPIQQFPQPIQQFPQQSLAPSQSVPLLPPVQTTFPPSIFPPTQSFIPQTSFAVPTGSLSPWFPSVPAIACGGTFSLSIVGDVSSKNSNSGDHSSKNSNSGDHNDKKTIALQVKAAGGTALDQNSISGQIFQGNKNIKNNNGNNFNIKSISNDCQVPTFIK
jgi:hypothetical protein